jgi:hypothetical protein
MWRRVRDILMVFRIFVSNKSTLKCFYYEKMDHYHHPDL